MAAAYGDLLRDLLPPLAPPVGTHEDPQLRVPAVGDLGGVLEVVEAVLALLLALRLTLQDGVVGEMAELDRQLLVDLLRLGIRDDVVGHRRKLPLPGS